MKTAPAKNMVCNICGKTKARSRMMPAALVRNAVAEQIKISNPDWKPEGYICLSDLNQYPFILLNLVLSCIAAIQAPVIMMSQNRQEAKDRLRSQNDYQVNLKAELEIRQLHDKIDHLLSHQWERLVEIQQIQIDLLSELAHLREKGKDL